MSWLKHIWLKQGGTVKIGHSGQVLYIFKKQICLSSKSSSCRSSILYLILFHEVLKFANWQKFSFICLYCKQNKLKVPFSQFGLLYQKGLPWKASQITQTSQILALYQKLTKYFLISRNLSYICLMPLMIGFNTLVIVTSVKFENLRNAGNAFIACLAVSDLLTGLALLCQIIFSMISSSYVV